MLPEHGRRVVAFGVTHSDGRNVPAVGCFACHAVKPNCPHFQQSLLGQLAQELGAVAFVEKGTDPSTLAETIRQVA